MELLTPLETRMGQAGEPVAVRIPLGWDVNGPYNNTTSGVLMQHIGPMQPGNAVQRDTEDSDGDLNMLLRDYFTLEEEIRPAPNQH